jgi:HK97 family phage major capsid protein
MNEMEKLQAEIKALGEQLAKATGETAKGLADRIDALQKQVDAIDAKMVERLNSDTPEDSVVDFMQKNDAVQRILRDKTGNVRIELDGKMASQLERKTLITSTTVGSATSGVLPIDRTSGIVGEARQELTIRNLLSARPTSMAQIDFIKVNAALAKGSPQVEGSAKTENTVTFTTAAALVRTIATWIPATRQILEDFTELMGFLQTNLPYQVNREEELQILSGDNTGQNLNGLITQAQSFDTGLLVAAAGWNRIDILGRAIQQIQADNEVMPTFVVLHPNDWWAIRLTKDSYGRYILGDPQQPMANPNIFGLSVRVTSNITSGTFLIGCGSAVCQEIRDRSGMTVEISTEHSTYFTENKVAIRAEKRLALVVFRPDSLVTGTFTTSP